MRTAAVLAAAGFVIAAFQLMFWGDRERARGQDKDTASPKRDESLFTCGGDVV